MAIGSLVAYQIGESDGAVVASTMLLTTLSFFHLVGRTSWHAINATRSSDRRGDARAHPAQTLRDRSYC